MGNRSRLHITGVTIRKDRYEAARRAISNYQSVRNEILRYFLSMAIVDGERFLSFRADPKGADPYLPDEYDTVPAKDAKWGRDEAIANWIKRYAGKGGSIIFHSLEGEGMAWGWEFDGKKRTRMLEVKPYGKWK